MTNICSTHKEYCSECFPCRTSIQDFFGFEIFSKIQRAKADGYYTCLCGLSYYTSNYNCPLCKTTKRKSCLQCEEDICQCCYMLDGYVEIIDID